MLLGSCLHNLYEEWIVFRTVSQSKLYRILSMDNRYIVIELVITVMMFLIHIWNPLQLTRRLQTISWPRVCTFLSLFRWMTLTSYPPSWIILQYHIYDATKPAVAINNQIILSWKVIIAFIVSSYWRCSPLSIFGCYMDGIWCSCQWFWDFHSHSHTPPGNNL
jgi:hypothetical protein